MTDKDEAVVFETELDAPPEKVWRALTIPEYLELWLDLPSKTHISIIHTDEPHSVTYRWRDQEDGAFSSDSVVTFEISPLDSGGSYFRLTHAPLAMPAADKSNEPMMLAA